MLFKVLKLFASNIFSFRSISESSSSRPKKIAKYIVIGLCISYMFAFYGFMYIYTMLTTYKDLKLTNQTELLPVICFSISTIMVLFFGFLSAANNYFTGSGEEQLLSMPLKAVDIFGAKIGVTFITDSLLGMFLFIIGGVIYGYNEGLLSSFSFYIGLIVSTLAVSITSVFFIYLLLILVLKLLPALRKKSILNGVATFFILIFAFAYSFLSTKTPVSFSGNQATQRSEALAAFAETIIEKLPCVKWLSGALTGNWLSILFLLLLFCLVTFIFIPLLAPLYLQTLNGFLDIKTKKISKKEAEVLLKKDTKVASISKALFLRDVRTVLREPSFFANGPLGIILFPTIIIISFTVGFLSVGSVNLDKLRFELLTFFLGADFEAVEKIKYFIILGASAFAIFSSNSTGLASSSFSRDGKALYGLKAMPIENDTILLVKFLHALMYTFVAFLVISLMLIFGILFLQLPFSAKEIIFMLAAVLCIELAVSLVLIFIEMFIDTANPKLNWENPIAAFKQNVNTLLSVFITIGVVALFLVLGILLLPKNSLGLFILAAIFAVISAPLGSCYWKYALKKIDRM